MTPTDLTATIRPCPSMAELAPAWCALEARAEASFFQSWRWIGAMLAEFGPASLLVEIRQGGALVGLGMLGRRDRRWDVLRSPSLHLGEVDDPASAALCTEYNGFLAVRGLEAQVTRAGLAALHAHGGWRELVLPGMSMVEGPARVTRRHLAPYALLGPDDPLDALSRNSRHQIRRSLKLYNMTMEKGGPAQDWFERLMELHGAYWRGRGQPGAFALPKVVAFHRRLLAAGDAEVLRLSDGGDEIGYLYNFVHDGWVYAYQSGFRYDPDPRRKPGLAGHLLAMRSYGAQGLRGYRFLAGDSRYKSSLATAKDQLVWAMMDRGDLLHRLERWLRHEDPLSPPHGV
ncbi:MAG: GNAT family N-acetyltransferase [Rhodospirillaceae bacterium]|nr:GNAT family N-acetyltransferase [Rhodospirillales bacterium]